MKMTIIKKSYLGFLLLLVLITIHSFSEKIEPEIYRPENKWDNSVKYERFACTFNHTYISTDAFDEIEKNILNDTIFKTYSGGHIDELCF